jgi:quercetin dioxygenase-like cupin family protein
LFVHGSANRTLSYIPQLRQTGVPAVEVPGSHHWLVADNPDFFYGAVCEFLTADGESAPSRQALDWVFNLDDASQGIPRELAEGVNTRIFPGEQAMLSVVTLEPHSQGKVHSHAQEQWGVLLRGECVRFQEGVEVPVKPGDFWRTPGHVPHGMRAGAKGALVLDIFSPPRPEYAMAGKGFGPGSEEQPK